MRTAVERQDAANRCRKFAARGALAFGLLWREDDFRIAFDFQDAVLHFAVAQMAAAVTADGEDNHACFGLPGRRIDPDRAPRELERSVSHVRPLLEGIVYVSIRWIQLQHGLSRVRRSS